MQGYILNIPIFSYNCFVDLNLEIHQLIDKEKIRESFREIIISIGENPDRDGLLDTPKRLAVLYEELFSGLKLNPDKNNSAVIGGGDGGVVRECISKGFKLIDWYELDTQVVEVCEKHLSKIGKKATSRNSVQCIWGDAFESIKKVEDNKYDKIFVDLNDDQYCIDLAAKNINSLKRILKTNGTITAQVGSHDKKPKQVEKWLKLFEKSFGNTSLDRIYIPSFDCAWNFASSLNK